MTRAEALARLRAHEAELRAMGAGAIYLFGSVARDEAGEGSDVDVLIDVVDRERFSLIDLIRMEFRMEEILGVDVDLGTRRSLKPRLRARIEADIVRAF